MKKFFTLLVLAACCAAMTWGCSDDKYDDTEIRQEIENLKQEIASMKEQVNSLKTIIDALNENKFITNYTEAADGSCTITFNDGKTITLHNGKDGAAAPAIGIAQFEGIYYWTLGGDDQWLLDDNQNKIPVAGQNGKTPTINKDGYWEHDHSAAIHLERHQPQVQLDDRRTRGRDRAFVHLYPDRNRDQKDRFHRNGHHRRTRSDPLEVHHAHQ